MVLVIGATGQIGRALVERLQQDGVPVRAYVRNRKRAAATLGDQVELAKGDLNDAPALAAAMQGVTKLFLNSAASPDMIALQGNAIDVAKRAGVGHIVAISTIGAAEDAPTHIGRWHAAIDAQLAASGIPYTILQPQLFVQNLLGSAGSVAESGELVAPMGNGRVALVDVRDVADVAAVILENDGYGVNEVWTVTGPEAVGWADIASKMSDRFGRKVTYLDADPVSARQGLVDAGAPEWFADDLAVTYAHLAAGGGADVTETVANVAGHSGRTLDYFLEDYAWAFSPPDDLPTETAATASEPPLS